MITATYSPEDNKIRLYSTTRLDAETYARVKAAGFKWAPKQELFVAPSWTPSREDLAIELAGEIEPEEMTLTERAQAKAERLEGIAHKRRNEAVSLHNHANELSRAFYMGQPILVGHHSERKARKTQERMHSAMDKAVKSEKAANYWLYRATGVEAHANMKNDPRTRANRIKTLLAELRDLQRGINRAHNNLALLSKYTEDHQIVSLIGNSDIAPYGLYSDVHAGKVSPQEAREKLIAGNKVVINGPNRKRCIEHILNRLAYERSMLGDVPRFDGVLTPVIIQAFAREHGAEKPKCTVADDGFFLLESPVLLPAHISENSWLELSDDEWRDVMQACGYTVPVAKPRRASSKPAPAPLVNPTVEQAEQLQRIWNLHMVAACESAKYATPKENVVKAMTQDSYSRNSKGTYSHYETREIGEDGRLIEWKWERMERVLSGVPVARIRVYSGGYETHKPRAVVHISDKPAKALPLDLGAIEKAALSAISVGESGE